MIKLIVSDIDGTLVPEGTHDIDPELYSVILELKEKGIQFAAASGRHWTSIDKFFAPVRDRIFYLADNGGYLGIHSRPLFVETIPQEAAIRFISDMKKIPDAEIVVSCPQVTYLDSGNEEFCSWIEKGYLYDVEKVSDLTKIKDPITKVACYSEKNQQEAYRQAQRNYSMYGDVVISGTAWIDLMPSGVNKGRAVKVLQESLNISPKETMAFGDQFNDVEMLEQAYYSFAVADARKEVCQKARFLADKSTEKGVLKVLKYLL